MRNPFRRRSHASWQRARTGRGSTFGSSPKMRPSARRTPGGAHVTLESSRDAARRGRRSTVRGPVPGVGPMVSGGASRRGRAGRARSGRAGIAGGSTAFRRSRRRGAALVAGIVGLAVVVACAVGFFSWRAQVAGQLSLDDPGVAPLLVPADKDGVETLLVTAHFRDGAGPVQNDYVALVGIDQKTGRANLVEIPAWTRYDFGGGSKQTLRDAHEVGGDGALVEAVGKLAGVKVNHFASIDATAFEKLVDEVGGVEMDLPETVDDPFAGTIVLDRGKRNLSGAEALYLMRARNYPDAFADRAKMQLAFLKAARDKLAGGMSVPTAIEKLAGAVKTDLGVEGLERYVRAFAADGDKLSFDVAPGAYLASEGGVATFSITRSSFAEMMERFAKGEAVERPHEAVDTSGVDPSKVTLTVRNGGGQEGAADRVAKALAAQGFQVKDTGNADSYVYGETLIVYKDPAKKADAEAVRRALGSGRVVDAGALYSFDTDVLVTVGKDYLPPQS